MDWIDGRMCQSSSLSIDQSINQSNNQSIRESVNQPIIQLIDREIQQTNNYISLNTQTTHKETNIRQ